MRRSVRARLKSHAEETERFLTVFRAAPLYSATARQLASKAASGGAHSRFASVHRAQVPSPRFYLALRKVSPFATCRAGCSKSCRARHASDALVILGPARRHPRGSMFHKRPDAAGLLTEQAMCVRTRDATVNLLARVLFDCPADRADAARDRAGRRGQPAAVPCHVHSTFPAPAHGMDCSNAPSTGAEGSSDVLDRY
jgi:hypothetical protein